MFSRNPSARVVYDIKRTGNLARVISEAGGEPEMWRTGHSLIKARMKATNALLGGEMSGHIFFKERWYGFDDGLYSAARLLEIWRFITKMQTPFLTAFLKIQARQKLI